MSTETNSTHLKDAKSKKNAENFIKASYLTLSSIICWYLMNQRTYLPNIMGGITSSNSLNNTTLNYPLIDHFPGAYTLILVLSGYPLAGTIRHL